MKNIEKLASEIIKQAVADKPTMNKIQMLWNQFKHNLDLFSQKLGETLKANRLSFAGDKDWLSNYLKKLTGQEWTMDQHDFVMASKK